jgi:uncharacterized protein
MLKLQFIVFAKAPVAGLAKTRLVPALGPAGAAALAERMLGHAVAACTGAQAQLGHCGVEICATPDAQHPAFQRLAQQHAASAQGMELRTQGEGDLGARMHRAFTRTLPQARGALLIGTDAPALDMAVLLQAAAALHDHDAVFVPALDGGYALVGLRRPAPALFNGMAWSTPQVMADTRDRARQAGLRWAELPAVADIDLPADLVHLPPGWLPAEPRP